MTSGLNLIVREAIPPRSNKRRINGLFPYRVTKLLATAVAVEPRRPLLYIFSAKRSAAYLSDLHLICLSWKIIFKHLTYLHLYGFISLLLGFSRSVRNDPLKAIIISQKF